MNDFEHFDFDIDKIKEYYEQIEETNIKKSYLLYLKHECEFIKKDQKGTNNLSVLLYQATFDPGLKQAFYIFTQGKTKVLKNYVEKLIKQQIKADHVLKWVHYQLEILADDHQPNNEEPGSKNKIFVKTEIADIVRIFESARDVGIISNKHGQIKTLIGSLFAEGIKNIGSAYHKAKSDQKKAAPTKPSKDHFPKYILRCIEHLDFDTIDSLNIEIEKIKKEKEKYSSKYNR